MKISDAKNVQSALLRIVFLDKNAFLAQNELLS